MTATRRLLAACLLLPLLAGCAILREFSPAVVMEPMSPGEYIALQRGDILTSGRLSALTAQSIRVSGLDVDGCASSTGACVDAMDRAAGVTDERRLSALAELWLQQAMALDRAGSEADARLRAWMEVARHAYAYLFFTGRTPGERVFEDRQTQVRDWYNYAVQEAIALLFEESRRIRDDGAPQAEVFERAGWTFRIDLAGIRMPEGVHMPQELLPAASLSFQGLRSTWRRDGFGAELVAVMVDDPVAAAPEPRPDAGDAPRRPPGWSEMPSPGMTVLFRFDGDGLDAVLAAREVLVSAHDPYDEDDIVLYGQRLPLAANFTAGYGLWLARSGFNRQSLRTLFGRGNGIDRPHLYMMQPYDPQRRIILMLHGLASSPEAWVNVANEIQGDDDLRRHYQIWQVYYPTNAPIVLNHAAIRRLLARTRQHFDPRGEAPAFEDMVLVGHSMGGVIGRLMVSSADDQLWAWAEAEHADELERLRALRPRMERVLRFEPVPGIGRAVFIASPHRGTDVAGGRLGRWISRMVRLPLTLLEGFGDALLGEVDVESAIARGGGTMPNSIDNLDARDPFVRAAADLPISPRLRYHSIVARLDPDGPLERSGDGLVPYPSAHLPGALSEVVITSGHSVQETPAAILELRRILHLDLREHAAASRDAAQDSP